MFAMDHGVHFHDPSVQTTLRQCGHNKPLFKEIKSIIVESTDFVRDAVMQGKIFNLPIQQQES